MLLLLFSACTYEYAELNPTQNNDTVDTIAVDSISFASTVFPIIMQNCLSCHGGFQPPNLNTHGGIKANASLVKATTSNRSMPRGGSLTAEEIEKIAQWVDQGAKNN